MMQISKTSLKTLPFFLPNLKFQEQFSSINRRISSIENELRDFKEEAWRDPKCLPNVISRLDSLQSEENSDWVQNLPFPLASVLRLYQTIPERKSKDRFETLLHFFELCSQFFAIIHISAWKRNEGMWDDVWGKFSSHMNKIHGKWKWLKKPSFGVWNEINAAFSKPTRTLLNDKSEDMVMASVLYASLDSNFTESISSKNMQSILKRANKIRNERKGHVGLISEKIASETHQYLSELLDEFRIEIQSSFSSTFLYQTGSGKPVRGGGYDWNVIVLTGPSTPFFEDEIFLIQAPTDPDKLYLGTSSTSELLPLVSMIKIGPPPKSAQTACYFYSGTDTDGHRYLSYHHDDSEYIEHDDDTQSILNFLQTGVD